MNLFWKTTYRWVIVLSKAGPGFLWKSVVHALLLPGPILIVREHKGSLTVE